jgi:hypothetical protein
MTVPSDRRTSLRRFLFILLATVALASTVGADDGDNLGQRIVRGRVYNLDRGEGVPIASATVSFRNLQGTVPDASGLAVTDVNGSFLPDGMFVETRTIPPDGQRARLRAVHDQRARRSTGRTRSGDRDRPR